MMTERSAQVSLLMHKIRQALFHLRRILFLTSVYAMSSTRMGEKNPTRTI